MRLACKLREKYQMPLDKTWEPAADLTLENCEKIDLPNTTYTCTNGVFEVQGDKSYKCPFSFDEFINDYHLLLNIESDGATNTFCYKRLKHLELGFDLHVNENAALEQEEATKADGVDFYTFPKVDNHIHHSGCMTSNHLLDFMKRKLVEEKDTIVAVKDGKDLRLKDVCDDNNISVEGLDLDILSVHGYSTYQRFDVFNSQFNPFGKSEFRNIFLKTSNHMNGRFLAELTQEVIEANRNSPNVFQEWRLSIYGRKSSEWDTLAKWVVSNSLEKDDKIRWLIQVPRIYQLWKKIGMINNFADIINNFFSPLFDATINPSAHPELNYFLNFVVGFDSVDNEATKDVNMIKFPKPEEWSKAGNPPYFYWGYYWYANANALNQLRKARGMNTFTYRPHCGEAGSVDHLAASFLTADCINHGIRLHEAPVYQYL